MVKVTQAQLERFLTIVDKEFPVPLSEKQDLKELSEKFSVKATICSEVIDGEIIAMVAGYTDNVIDGLAYISVVATLKCAQGKGLAKKLIFEFISECERKNLSAVHLYTDCRNQPAIKMYERLGFEHYSCLNEIRPDDIHFIYYINKEK